MLEATTEAELRPQLLRLGNLTLLTGWWATLCVLIWACFLRDASSGLQATVAFLTSTPQIVLPLSALLALGALFSALGATREHILCAMSSLFAIAWSGAMIIAIAASRLNV